MRDRRISEGRIKFGIDCTRLAVHFLSEEISVTPTLLVKLLPKISHHLPGFFPFISGIHFYGESSLDSESLYKRALANKTLEIIPCSRPKNWWQPLTKTPIKQEVISNINHSEMDRIARDIGVSLDRFEKTLKFLIRQYTGNPAKIERATTKEIIDKLFSPVQYLYYSDRWEQREKKYQVSEWKPIKIGPIPVYLPSLVRELPSKLATIASEYSIVLSNKEQENSGVHFRVNAIKSSKENLTGTRCILCGYFLADPKKVNGETQLLKAVFYDSVLYPTKKHTIVVYIDTSDSATFNVPITQLKNYELYVLGIICGHHVKASAIIQVRQWPDEFNIQTWLA